MKKINYNYFGSWKVVPKFSRVNFLLFLGVFLGVRGVPLCPILAQICPWDWLTLEKENFCMYIKNEHVNATFLNLI